MDLRAFRIVVFRGHGLESLQDAELVTDGPDNRGLESAIRPCLNNAEPIKFPLVFVHISLIVSRPKDVLNGSAVPLVMGLLAGNGGEGGIRTPEPLLESVSY
jgi:hypothetical protein